MAHGWETLVQPLLILIYFHAYLTNRDILNTLAGVDGPPNFTPHSRISDNGRSDYGFGPEEGARILWDIGPENPVKPDAYNVMYGRTKAPRHDSALEHVPQLMSPDQDSDLTSFDTVFPSIYGDAASRDQLPHYNPYTSSDPAATTQYNLATEMAYDPIFTPEGPQTQPLTLAELEAEDIEREAAVDIITLAPMGWE